MNLMKLGSQQRGRLSPYTASTRQGLRTLQEVWHQALLVLCLEINEPTQLRLAKDKPAGLELKDLSIAF